MQAAGIAHSSVQGRQTPVMLSAPCPVGQMHIFFRQTVPEGCLGDLDAFADAALNALHARHLLLPSDCLQVQSITSTSMYMLGCCLQRTQSIAQSSWHCH